MRTICLSLLALVLLAGCSSQYMQVTMTPRALTPLELEKLPLIVDFDPSSLKYTYNGQFRHGIDQYYVGVNAGEALASYAWWSINGAFIKVVECDVSGQDPQGERCDMVVTPSVGRVLAYHPTGGDMDPTGVDAEIKWRITDADSGSLIWQNRIVGSASADEFAPTMPADRLDHLLSAAFHNAFAASAERMARSTELQKMRAVRVGADK